MSFDYRLVGKRRGYEGQRLKDVTERCKADSWRRRPSRRRGEHSWARMEPKTSDRKKERLRLADEPKEGFVAAFCERGRLGH